MRLAVATLADVWAHALLKNWHPCRHEYSRLVAETVAGRVAVGFDGGLPIAIGGVFRPDDTAPGTCWLSVTDPVSRRIVPAALLMRHAIRRLADPRGLVCHVAERNEAGARLAQALGFTATDRFVGPLREWVYGGRSDRQDGETAVQPRA